MAYRPYETGEMAAEQPTSELASPGVRLVAWIIDFLIYFVVAIVALIIGLVTADLGIRDIDFDTGFFLTIVVVIGVTLLAFLVIFIIQMVLLATRGQTIGKIIMKIRIVDAQTGEHPGWARLILLRTIVNGLIYGVVNAIPVAGQGLGGLYFIIDSLFIFRADRRTIHDFIAGTRVDKIAD